MHFFNFWVAVLENGIFGVKRAQFVDATTFFFLFLRAFWTIND